MTFVLFSSLYFSFIYLYIYLSFYLHTWLLSSGQRLVMASITVRGTVRQNNRSDTARFRINMFLKNNPYNKVTGCLSLCLSLFLRISLTAELLWFSFTVKLLIDPEMVLGYFILINKSGYGFLPLHTPSNIDSLDTRGATVSS